MDKVMKKMVEGDAADRAVEVAPRKVYIINYKEHIIDEDGCMSDDFGTFDYAYADEDEAKKVLADVAQKRVDEFDEEEQKDVTETWGAAKDCVCIGYRCDTYEYSIYMVTVL